MSAALAPVIIALLPLLERALTGLLDRIEAADVEDPPTVAEHLAELAEQHVRNISVAKASDEDKRRMVREALRDDCNREGLRVEGAPVKDRMLNLVIELAYNARASQTGEAPDASG